MAESGIALILQTAIGHHQAGRLAQAEPLYRQILSQQPDNPDALHLLGVLARQVGRHDAAVELIRRAIAIQPGFGEFHNNLGNALRDSGQLDEAIVAFRRAIAIKPRYAEAYVNLGIGLADKGQTTEAIEMYKQAIALNSSFSEAHNNLAVALRKLGRPDEALSAVRAALVVNPNSPEGLANLAVMLRDVGEIDEVISASRKAVDASPGFSKAQSNLLYNLHFHPAVDAQALAAEHRNWNSRHAAPLQRFIEPHANNRNPDRRLRIGYVSSDFRDHPVGRFLLPLLTKHDRRQFELFCYVGAIREDNVSAAIRARVDHWKRIAQLNDDQAARLIRSDEIDILVDLSAHASGDRLLVFARKPAPVQVTYLSYCSTTGLDTMDYRISDPYLDSPGADESVYSEKTIRLPESYWCYQPPVDPSQFSPGSAIRHDGIVFGCLNNFSKVNESAISTWAAILHDVPNSRLLLHTYDGAHRERLRARFARDGIENHRIAFTGFLPIAGYFNAYRTVDIALDTFPYGGGTTTCDAMWMGVPVVSLVGRTAVGRGGLSILSNIGLPEFAARSPEQYVRIAIDLAGDITRLTALRATLRQRMEQSPLMNANQFSRNIETGYRTMWRAWCARANINAI